MFANKDRTKQNKKPTSQKVSTVNLLGEDIYNTYVQQGIADYIKDS